MFCVDETVVFQRLSHLKYNAETFQKVGGAHMRGCSQSQLINSQNLGRVDDDCGMKTASSVCYWWSFKLNNQWLGL